jgi:hypothetical protein
MITDVPLRLLYLILDQFLNWLTLLARARRPETLSSSSGATKSRYSGEPTPSPRLDWAGLDRTARGPEEELTDRILIFGERHLRTVLARYSVRYNGRRPHRALRLLPPRPDHPTPDLDSRDQTPTGAGRTGQ